MEKRGQAAMEFLMTYGWAILAAIIAIGALYAFGVFSPGRFTPDACIINNPLGCSEHSVNATAVRLIITNGAGDSVTISNVSVTNCDSVAGGTVANGANADIQITCAHTVGDKFTGDISVTYMKSGATIAQTATGSISGKVA